MNYYFETGIWEYLRRIGKFLMPLWRGGGGYLRHVFQEREWKACRTRWDRNLRCGRGIKKLLKTVLSVKSIRGREGEGVGHGSNKSSYRRFLFCSTIMHLARVTIVRPLSPRGTAGFSKGKLIVPRSRISLAPTLVHRGMRRRDLNWKFFLGVGRLYKDFRSSVTRKEGEFFKFWKFSEWILENGRILILELEKFWNS